MPGQTRAGVAPQNKRVVVVIQPGLLPGTENVIYRLYQRLDPQADCWITYYATKKRRVRRG